MNFLRTHKVEIFIFALALTARLIYFGLSYQAQNGDLIATISGADGYFTVSQNLILGNGLSSDQGPPYTPYSFRPPLYHFFIAGAHALFGGYGGVIFFQILIASFLPVLGMRLASYLVESRKIILALGIILSLEPSAILYSVFFYAETFFMFWFFISLLYLFKYLKDRQLIYLALSAFLLGLATLTRPTTEYVPLIIVAVLLWAERKNIFSRKILINSGVYVAVFLITISPWVYRNYTVFGVPGISPQAGVNLYTTLLPTVYSIEKGTTFQEEFAALMASGVRGPNDAYITDGKKYKEIAIPILVNHPKGLFLSALNSGLSFFTLDGTFDFLRHIKIRPREMIGKPSLVALFSDPASVGAYFSRNLNGPLAFILLGRLLWIGITILFLFGVWRYIVSRGAVPQAMAALMIIFYFGLISLIAGFGLTARYRLPVNSLIVTFALYGVATLAPFFWRKARLLYA